jgi:glycerol-3-phosphate dehydrogenase
MRPGWPDREEQLRRLRSGAAPYDVLVVGGGATGTGVALDAATRGLSVALVDRGDFSSGTSSRSTKLIHGGVRYLEKAVKHFDRSQFNLVRDALHERAILLKIAPHLSHPLPIVTPLYNWLDVPYYLTGLKLYDWLAGRSNLQTSRFVDAKEALQRFPMLRQQGLRGGVLYYDGQFDDARMNLAIALTAAREGAVIANHVCVTALALEDGRVRGAELEDRLSGQRFAVAARVVVNATGPFTDGLRRMEDPAAEPMVTASSGIHIVLDQRFSPPATGLLIPQTEDGRVLFLMPWLGHTLVGTTDNEAAIEENPRAHEDEIAYVLRHVDRYFAVPVSRSDVKAAWSGLRPLVADPHAADTAGLSRDHVVNVGPAGLVTVAGGKWTTYRRMAVDAVNEAVRVGELAPARASATESLPLVGAEGFSAQGAGALQERFGLDADVASYLNRAYGSFAAEVAALAKDGHGARLLPEQPYLEAEVVYAARFEYARSSADVLWRRLRVAMLDEADASAALERVSELLAGELGWSRERREGDRDEAGALLGQTQAA